MTQSHVAFIKDEIITLLLSGSENITLTDLSEEIIAGLCPNDCSQNGLCRLDLECLDTRKSLIIDEDCLSPGN